jgi:hypothetical protein
VWVAVAAVAALTLATVTSAAAAPAQTVFVNESFTGASVSGYLKPSAPAGSNVACLTAGSDTTATPVPGCASTAIDAAGSGALRLTSSGGTLEGGVGAVQSVPISKGLDATFNSYQYGGTAADGIVFYLSVTDPYNPQVPKAIGQAGGSLGYSPTGSSPGLANGYLGLGLDVYGNYLNSGFDGSGCSSAPGNTTQPTNVTVRGPGSGPVGYCVLPGYNSSLGGKNALHGTTRANSQVPVEVVINPSASSTMSAGTAKLASVAVAAMSYAIVFNTIGAATQTVVTGVLPDLRAAAYKDLVDSSWYDPNTGLPYKLTYGWVASTGGSTDVHEVNNFTAQTLTGQVPELGSTSTVSTSTPQHGSSATYTVTPSVLSSGGSESATVKATTTFPAGLTPTAYTGTAYTCSISGQTESCTYTGTTAAGAALPALALPFIAAGGANSAALTISSLTSSTDATAVSSSSVVSIAKVTSTTTLAVAPTSPMYGSSLTLTATVSGATPTGSVAFVDTTTGTTLCAAATVTNGLATCTTTAAGPAGTHGYSATYSGDTDNTGSTGALTAGTLAATSTITAAASPDHVAYGSASTLTVAGIPAGAAGTVTFTDAGGATLCTATAAAASCDTSVTLASGTYAVTAAYSGDANYAPSTSSPAALTVTPASATLVATVDGGPSSTTAYGTAATLDASGLAATATGTIEYREGSAVLCSVDLANGTSCDVSAALGTGSHDIVAYYLGDANHAAATSAAVQLTVVKAGVTSLAATVDGRIASAVTHGTTATLNTTGGPAGATGAIAYASADGAELCRATLPVTSCITPKDLAGGVYAVTAHYSGDGNHQAADAPTVTLTVTPEASVIAAKASAKARTSGSRTTITATGIPTGATGAIAFTVVRGLLCTATLPQTSCTTTDLAAGQHTITVSYSGDASYAASSTTITVTVPAVVLGLAFTGSSPQTGILLDATGLLLALGIALSIVACRGRRMSR